MAKTGPPMTGNDFPSAKGGSRLDILIGEKALADYKCRFENTQKISALLSVKPEQTAEAAQKLLQTVADLKQELGALKLRLLEEKVDAVETGNSAGAEREYGRCEGDRVRAYRRLIRMAYYDVG